MEEFHTVNFWSFAIGFYRKWLLPKLAVLVPVWLLTQSIFSISSDLILETELKKLFEKIFNPTSNHYFIYCLMWAISILGILHIVHEHTPIRKSFKRCASRIGRPFGSLVSLVFGLFWVPLIFSTAGLYALNITNGAVNIYSIWIYVCLYIICAFFISWITERFELERPRRYILYSLKSKDKLRAADVKKIFDRVNSLIGGIHGVVYLSVTLCASGKIIYVNAGQALTVDYKSRSKFIDLLFSAIESECSLKLHWERVDIPRLKASSQLSVRSS